MNRNELLKRIAKRADDAYAFTSDAKVILVTDVIGILDDLATYQPAKYYPKDCPVSDFHCTYPECTCGR